MKKINIKNYFSKKLYIEALNQTKISGLFIVIATLILCCLHPFTEMADSIGRATNRIGVIGAMEGNIALIVMMYIAPLFLAFSTFDFLSKRKACDFYHSMPVKRESLFCSFALAGLTWLVSALLIGGLSSLTFFSCLPNIHVNALGYLQVILSAVAGSLMIYFASLVAISASGNKMTQILLALVIAFMPHIIWGVLMGEVDNVTHITNYSNVTFPSPLCVISVFGIGRNSLSAFYSVSVILQSFTLAIIYAILAGVIFTKRKSELAGNNAPSKLWQHVYRSAIMLPFAILFVAMWGEDFSTYAILIAISLIVYIGYELATSKNYKTAIKAIPFYAVVIAMSLVMMLFISGVAFVSCKITPNANQISSVNIQSTLGIESNTNEYFIHASRHKVTDKEIIEIISNRLEETIEVGGRTYLMEENGKQEFYRVNVKINSGIFSYNRYVLVSKEEYEMISQNFATNTQLTQYIEFIPERADVLNITMYGSGSAQFYDEIVKNEIVDSMYEEFNALSKEEKYEVITFGNGNSATPVFAAIDTSYIPDAFAFRINLTTLEKFDSHMTTIYVTPLMPKTYEMMLEYSYHNQAKEDKVDIENFKKGMNENSEIVVDIDIFGQDGEKIVFNAFKGNGGSLTMEDCNQVIEKIQSIPTVKADSLESLYSISISMENMDAKFEYEGGVIYECFIRTDYIAPLTAEDLEFFKTLQKNQLVGEFVEAELS